MKHSIRRLGLLSAGLALMLACSGEPTTPPLTPAAAPQASLLGSLINVGGLQRTMPLASPITVTKTIGSGGGTLSIPSAGVTVTVPSGALASNTVITMTARAGTLVAYDFAPHGIVFAKPLTFSQSLNGTNATLLTAPLMSLAYYEDASLLTAAGGVVNELVGGTVNLLTWTFTSNIKHFSGYLVSCGRADLE